MKKKTLFTLLAILIVAGFLRFWQLSKVPISLDWDDVSVGYNSYSILETGKDEYGNFLPISIRSLDDYKPAMYTYFTVPSVAVFGLNPFAVRFPNAIFGTLTVLFAFLFIKEVFKRDDIALLSSFLLAISPWSIQFSRFAHETNIALGFNILTAFFFLKGLKNGKYLIIAAVFSGLSLYTYQSEKIFAPALALTLIIIFGKKLLTISRKYLLTSFVVGFLFSLPMLLFIFTDSNALSRAKDVQFFSNTTRTLGEKYASKIATDRKNNDLIGLVFDNRRVAYARTAVSNYLSHFDPNWLFVTGDTNIGRHQPPRMGHLYLVELPLFLIGFFVLFFGKFDRKIKILIFSWIIISPIAASITWDVPNAGRTLNFLPMFQVLTALGLLTILSIDFRVAKIRIKNFVAGLIILLFTFNFLFYFNEYFTQQNYFQYSSWQYGYEQMVPRIQGLESQYKKIIVSNRAPLDQSYIFFLFYLKYPPGVYQKTATSGAYGVKHQFGKYQFDNLKWQEGGSDTLYVGSSVDFPDNAKKDIKETVYNPDGSVALLAVSGE